MTKAQLLSTTLTAGCLIFAFSAAAQDTKKDLRAVIQEIDPTVGTITVILTEGTKNRVDRIRTFNLLKPDIPVTDASDKPRKLTDLQTDDRVLLKLTEDDVAAIRLMPPALYGTLAKLDAKGQTAVVRTKFGDKAIAIPATAKIYNQNQLVELQGLKIGGLVLVSFADDLKTVIEVRTGKTLPTFSKLVKGTGSLIDLDRELHSVRLLINTSSGDYSLLRTVAINKDASFGLMLKAKHFREITEADLGVGVKVQYWIDNVTGKLAHLEIEMPILGRRPIKKFDIESRQLALEDRDGDKILKLSPQVKIQTMKGPGRLEDLRPQVTVSVALSPDRKTAEFVQVFGN